MKTTLVRKPNGTFDLSNLTLYLANFSIVKHDYDTDEFIEARIQDKLKSLRKEVEKDMPNMKHYLYYDKRENKSRYYIRIYDMPSFIVSASEMQLLFQDNENSSLDALLK